MVEKGDIDYRRSFGDIDTIGELCERTRRFEEDTELVYEDQFGNFYSLDVQYVMPAEGKAFFTFRRHGCET